MKRLNWCAFVCGLLISTHGFSMIYVCGMHTNPHNGYTGKECHVFSGKCDDEKNLGALEIHFPGGWTCVGFGNIAVNRGDVHLISTKDGAAYLVIKGDRTPVGSDALLDFLMSMQRESEMMRVNTQAMQDQFDAFLGTDNGVVSDARLKELSRDLGVPIESESGPNPGPDPGTGRGGPAVDHGSEPAGWTSKHGGGSIPSGSRRPDSCSLPDCSCRVVSPSGASLCEGGTEKQTEAGVHYCKCGRFGPSSIQEGGAGGAFTADGGAMPARPAEPSPRGQGR